MAKTNTAFNLRMSIYTSMFTALIIVGAYISVPLPGGIPIVLTDFFIMLAAFFLGCKYGTLAAAIYVGLGALGLPVFSGGGNGMASVFGPSGGFIFGYIIMAFTIGFITDKGNHSAVKNIIAVVVGNVLMFALGLVWLKAKLDLSMARTIAVGLTPFLIGNTLKIIASFIISITAAKKFREKIASMKEQYESSNEIAESSVGKDSE